MRQFRLGIAAVSIHLERLPGGHFLEHHLKLIFGDGKDGADGVHLRNDQQSVGVASLHDIPRVDQPQPDAPGGRRRDLAVSQVDLGAFDLPLVEFHHPFVLMHGCLLGGQLLFRDGLLRNQLLIADQVDARVLQGGLVAHQLPFGLGQCRPIGSVVDFHQQIALVNGVAFAIPNAHQLPVDPALDGNRSQGRNRAKPRIINADVPLVGRRCHHWYGRRRWRRGLRTLRPQKIRDHSQQEKNT